MTATTPRASLLSPILAVLAADWPLVLLLIFGGCCSNVFTLEVLISDQPKSGDLITFAQFLLVAVEGAFSMIERAPSGSLLPLAIKQSKIPLSRYAVMVTIFFLVSVLNNQALSYDIPVPLHIIFRSASLLASMLVGWLFFSKRFTFQQILGTSLITAGIVTATFASSKSQSHQSVSAEGIWSSKFLMGIAIMTIGVILACVLGQVQQSTYSKYGSAWRESLFFTHALSLPGFLFVAPSILQSVEIFNRSPMMSLAQYFNLGPSTDSLLAPFVGFNLDFKLPKLWIFLILNSVTQYVCISGVHKLASMTSPVTVNLVLSVRKLVSLCLSIYIFKNPFTSYHWLGVFAVAVGTALYMTASQSASHQPVRPLKPKATKED
ncbi:UAA transporter [Polychytrium aggregatum]|uniref:UAA transporter n=1 Tax=Polychytrium aggregatum TaxID=110093 RepID=UPI0022FE62F9|nr:UAA transporter [Polychytrium aggregatum]KAI9203087.1 UAA transporter [Polychytrium aggregatum]